MHFLEGTGQVADDCQAASVNEGIQESRDMALLTRLSAKFQWSSRRRTTRIKLSRGIDVTVRSANHSDGSTTFTVNAGRCYYCGADALVEQGVLREHQKNGEDERQLRRCRVLVHERQHGDNLPSVCRKR
jgi:hypothetical protein